jgi:Fur family peroxide stress response transcriptional regulator
LQKTLDKINNKNYYQIMKERQTARKHSDKRDAILRVIQSTESHPGARWVYEQLKPAIPGLSLATVYRNIGVFQEEGAVVSVGVVKGEERFDGRVEPHPHFICEKCGVVLDFAGDFQPENSEFLLGISGCIIDKRKTMFYGLCKACSANRNTGKKRVSFNREKRP